MLDRHYTPSVVSTAMINAVSNANPAAIADFAAGRGELLRRATDRWLNAAIVANDVDPTAIRYLRRSHKNWITSRSDFFDAAAREMALGKYASCIDLVLLNPPFSCRGGTVRALTYLGLELRCSTALAFVIASLPFLSPTGELIAVVPHGSLRSDKDREAWSVVKTVFDVDHVIDFGRETFQGCAVSSAIVRAHRPEAKLRCLEGKQGYDLDSVTIRRGTLPVHRAKVSARHSKGFLPFIHSSRLRNNTIEHTEWTKPEQSVVTGPAVLLPRVGRPDFRKLAVLYSSQSAVLSDCVLAIYCDSDESATLLQETMLKNWDLIAKAYGGTCAPYITVAEVRRVVGPFLEQISRTSEKIAARG